MLIVPFVLSCTKPQTDSGETGGPSVESWNPEDVETYKYSETIVSSRKYLVVVNGVRQTVYPTSEGQICTFGCDKEVQVKDEAVRARQTEYNMYANGYSKDVFYNTQLDEANQDQRTYYQIFS